MTDEAEARLATPGSDPDDAWAEANAVLPGVYRVRDVTHVAFMDPPNSHVAVAVNIGPVPVDRYPVRYGYGDSPSGALRDLTRKLRGVRDGERP